MVIEAKAEAATEVKAPESQETPPAAETPAAAEPDYKAEVGKRETRIAELEAEKTRLETRLNGVQGTLHQRQDWENQLRRTDQRAKDAYELLDSYLKNLDGSNPELLAQTRTRHQARSEEDRNREVLEGRLRDDWGEVMEVMAEAKGLPLATEADGVEVQRLLANDPEWKEVNALLQEGWQKGNESLTRRAAHKARTLAMTALTKVHKANLQAEVNRVKQEAEAETQKKLAPFMKSVNPAAAGVSLPALENLIDREGVPETPAERAEYLKSLKEAAQRALGR